MRPYTLPLLFLISVCHSAGIYAGELKEKESSTFDIVETLGRLTVISDASPFHLVNVDTPLPYRQYTNDRYLKFQFSQELLSEQQWVDHELKTIKESPGYEAGDPITLDLVFHLLYSSDTAKALEEVDKQIEALNRDFGPPVFPEKEEHDPEGKFRSLASDTGIRFKLSDYKSHAEGISGFQIIETKIAPWTDYNGMKQAGNGSPPISPTNTVNIWVIETDEDIGSYAQLPGGPPGTDGIVIDRRFFGSGSLTYTGSKTLTHLMGNYLGLIDLWGLYPCTDDGVSDTPIHNAPNLGDPTPRRISTCQGYPPAMVINFMENTNDANMYMFTKGQVQRMRYILSEQGLRVDLSKTN